MKRIILLFAAALSFLCACSDSPVARGTTVTMVSGTAKPSPFEQIVFAVDTDADDTLFLAAQSFCRKVNSISKSGLTLTVSTYPDAMTALESGAASFALLDGKKSAGIHPLFKIATENFRYKSYEHFSVSCNSAPVLKALSEKINATVYAAYYTGSDYFISRDTLDNSLIPSKSEDEAVPPAAYTIPDSGARDALSFLNVTSKEVLLFPERLATLKSENAVFEISFDELDKLTPQAEGLELVLTQTFHSVSPTWLIVAPSLYESLSPPERAAIDEAAAFLAADVDMAFLSREREALSLISDANITLSDDCSLVHARILRGKNDTLNGLSLEERDFRGLLDRIV